MEFLILIVIILVVWYGVWSVKQKMKIGNLKAEARDYFGTYRQLRDVTMSYASKDVLYHETVSRMLKKHLPSGYDASKLASDLVLMTVEDDSLDSRCTFRYIVTVAILTRMAFSRGYIDGRQLPNHQMWFHSIYEMVADIIPENI